MKKYLTLLSASIVLLSSANAAFAADNKMQEGAKKVGSAIVWPFKKMGQGLKAMGNGMKKMVGKG
jgi:putative cell wall-binding protein